MLRFLRFEPVFNSENHHRDHAPTDGRVHTFKVIPQPNEGLTFLAKRYNKIAAKCVGYTFKVELLMNKEEAIKALM